MARTVGEDIYRFFGSLPLLVGGTVILPAVVVGALVFLTRAWPRFLLVRAVAVMKRQLPWRLPEFLVDARARNIFRQSAGAYQFRHVRLQESLANQAIETTLSFAVTDPRSRKPLPGGDRSKIFLTAILMLLAVISIPKVVPRNSAQSTFPGQYGLAGYAVAISEGAKTTLVAAYNKDDPTVRVWDLRSGTGVSQLTNGQGGVESVWFSDDGRSLLIQASGKVESDRADDNVSVWSSGGRPVATAAGCVVMLAGGRSVVVVRPESASKR